MPISKQILTAANIVTTVRIALIPAFVFVILAPWPSWIIDQAISDIFAGIKPLIAAAVFAILALTDSVDGYLARSRNEVTTLGKFLDPLADKILVTAALLALTELGGLPAWVALVIIAREFLVSGLRMVASAEGLVIAASPMGKLKTVFQIIAIIVFILKDVSLLRQLGSSANNVILIICWVIMVIAVILTLLSLADYFFKAAAAFGLPLQDGSKPDVGLNECVSAEQLINKAKLASCTIATAESCTGGLVAAALTDIPGASEVFVGSIVSYSNAVKHSQLAVASDILASYGAVSEQVAKAMALGALTSLQSDLAVSVTGIAGPDGATVDKPVGTVWIGLATRGGENGEDRVFAELYNFRGDRNAIRTETVDAAVNLMYKSIPDA